MPQKILLHTVHTTEPILPCVLWACLYLCTASCSGKAFIVAFCMLNFEKHCQIWSLQWLGHRGPALQSFHAGTYRGANSHMNELNKSDHIYIGSYKSIATWDMAFAVIKGTILRWNCWIQFCHAHSLANSLCDNEHSLPVFKFKPGHLNILPKKIDWKYLHSMEQFNIWTHC